MKKILLSIIILAGTLAISQSFAHAERRIGDDFALPTSTRMFKNVPIEHWSYSVLQKLRPRFETGFKPQPLQHPIFRYNFAIVIMRCGDRAGNNWNIPEIRDLFVALRYEYGMEIIGVLTLGKAGFDGYYSEADKKKFTAFSLMAQKKHDTLSPDQWSDFLDETQRSPLFTEN